MSLQWLQKVQHARELSNVYSKEFMYIICIDEGGMGVEGKHLWKLKDTIDRSVVLIYRTRRTNTN